MNSLNTEMHASTPRMRRFLRHLGEASENLNHSKRLEKRKTFVEKIGSLTEEPPVMHEEFLKSDAKNIESQIRRALNLEQNLFERQKEDESRLSELREVEQKLFENQKQDEIALDKTRQEIQEEEDNVDQLRDELSDFRHKIASTQKFDEQALRQNSERIDQISVMMSKLNEKLEELSRIKEDVQGRAQKIETKIQKQVQAPVFSEPELPQPQQRVFLIKKKDMPLMPKREEPKEIIQKQAVEDEAEKEDKVSKRDLKKHLTLLTKHHEKMIKAGYHSESDLSRLQNKINKLKKKLK